MRIIDEKIDGSRAVKYGKMNDLAYFFEIDDMEYEVTFDSASNTAEVEFTANKKGYHQPSFDMIPVGFAIAQKVFHTVWKIIQEFLEATGVSILEFSAKNSEPSRVKFYKTLALQLANYYGYEAEDVLIERSPYEVQSTHFGVPVGPIE